MGCGLQRETTTVFIPSKTATLVPGFEVKDLPLDRTTNLVVEFAVKDLSLGRNLMMMIMADVEIILIMFVE